MALEYAKVILYAYPHLRALAEASETAARNRACLSYRSRLGTLEEAERIAEELAVRARLLRLAAAMDDIVRRCTREEKFLLEYRYFQRRNVLREFGVHALPCSERTYFRRQQELLRRTAHRLAARGWTEEAYTAAFAGYAPFVRVLRAIADGRESSVAAKRERRGLTFGCPQNSSRSRGGFLPRARMTATATAAMHASTMTTI